MSADKPDANQQYTPLQLKLQVHIQPPLPLEAKEKPRISYRSNYPDREVWELDEEESKAVEDLRSKLGAEIPDNLKTEDILIRFLRARKLDQVKSLEMYTNWLKWRVQVDLDHVLDKPPPFGFYEIKMAIPCYDHGYDKKGRPVYWQKVGGMQVDNFCRFSIDEIVNMHIYHMQSIIKRMKEAEMRTGIPCRQQVHVIDIDGASLVHRKTLPYMKVTTALDQDYYPEYLGTMILINAPSVFPVLWGMIKGFMDKRTQDKIRIYGSDYKQHLLDLIEPNYIPAEYGGACKCETKERGCLPVFSLEDANEALGKLHLGNHGTSLESKVIDARGKFELPIKIEKPNTVVSWYFDTEKNDIAFGAEWVPESKDKPKSWVKAMARHNSFQTPVKGSYTCMSPGVLKLLWDNSYSYFTSKKVNYSVLSEVITSQEVEEFQRDQHAHEVEDEKHAHHEHPHVAEEHSPPPTGAVAVETPPPAAVEAPPAAATNTADNSPPPTDVAVAAVEAPPAVDHPPAE